MDCNFMMYVLRQEGLREVSCTSMYFRIGMFSSFNWFNWKVKQYGVAISWATICCFIVSITSVFWINYCKNFWKDQISSNYVLGSMWFMHRLLWIKSISELAILFFDIYFSLFVSCNFFDEATFNIIIFFFFELYLCYIFIVNHPIKQEFYEN